eukprot:g12864.t1
MSNQIRFTRRRFLQASAATSAWALGASSYNRVFGANDRLNVSFIGTGGICGGQHIAPLHALGAGCAAYCDTDTKRMGGAASRYPDAKAYTDYREMFDKEMKNIDAVMVGTPDHHHYPATIIAMMNGKHAYTQKPLTHTVWEARQLAIATKKYKLATQMGNQLHANEGNRRIAEWVRSGQLGVIKEAHIWTNRPVWPQGNPKPTTQEDPPENLDWEAWIGPAAMRPFTVGDKNRRGGAYHPFNWRGFVDFGTGALGDMGCHTTDGFYWGMDPGFPTAVELLDGEALGDKDMYDKQAAVKFEFPEKDSRPAFNYFWYEGGMKPAKPDFIEGELSPSGGFILGEKGAIQYMDDYGNEIKIYLFGSETRVLHAKFDAEDKGDADAMAQIVPQTMTRSEGHHKEWFLACKGEKPYHYPRSNFRYASMLTESVLLGTIVQKTGGRLEYDAFNQAFTNNDDANALVSKEYREGWDFKMS